MFDQYLDLILQYQPDLIFIFDKDYNYLKVVARNPSLLILPKEDLIGKNLKEVLKEKHFLVFKEKLELCLSTKEVVDIKYHIQINHEFFEFDGNIRPIEDGNFLFLVKYLPINLNLNSPIDVNYLLTQIIDYTDSFVLIYQTNQIKVIRNKKILNFFNSDLLTLNQFINSIYKEDLENFIDSLNSISQSNPYVEAIIRFIDLSNKSHWLRFKFNAFSFDSLGAAEQVLIFAEDFTDDKIKNDDFYEIRKRFEFSIIASETGVWEWNLKTNEVYYSNIWKSMLGYSNDEITNTLKDFTSIIHPDDYDLTWNKIKSFLNKELPKYEFEFRLKCKDGTYKWILSKADVLNYDTDGSPISLVGIHTDIDKVKKNELTLNSEKLKFKAILDSIPGVFWIINLEKSEFEFLSANVNDIFDGCIYVGQASHEFLQFIHPDDLAMVLKENDKLWEGGNFNLEYRVKLPKRDLIWIASKGVVVNLDGVDYFMGYVDDITEKKLQELEILKQKKELDLAQSTAKLGSWYIEIDTMEVYWSDETKRIHEVDLVYQPSYEGGLAFYTEKSLDLLKETFNNTLATGEGWEIELELKSKKNKPKFIKSIGMVEIVDYKIKRIYGTCQDITQTKKSESEKNKIFDVSLDKLAIFDIDGNFQEINKSWETKLGWSKKELIGTNFTIYVHPQDINATITTFINSQTTEIHSFENRFRKKDGDYLWLSWKAYPDIDNKRIYASARDISESKYKSEELENAILKANEANIAKSRFLATMSHEIRTPMNSILGFSELLKDKKLDSESQGYVKSIINSGKTLLTLINDILDLSKIESGKLNIKLEEFNVSDLLQEQIDIFSWKAHEKDLQLILEIDKDFPETILSDNIRIRQILLNLIGNAIKFTDKGQVKIFAKSFQNEKNFCDLLIEVIDTGIGIKSSSLQTIFETFHQQDQQSTRKYGGTGLGLAISKRLANLMNGDIKVKSKVGVGSTFTLILKNVEIKESKKKVKSDLTNQPIGKLSGKVLVAEDNDLNYALVEAIINKFGKIDLVRCYDGEEVIHLLNTTDYYPDLILMDINMPILDGIETNKLLKLNDKFKDIPVIALTANALDNEKNANSAFFNDYITKPIDQKLFKEKLSRFLTYSDNKTKEKIEKIEKIIDLKELEEHKNQILIILDKIENAFDFELIKDLMAILNSIIAKRKKSTIKSLANKLNKLKNNFQIDELKIELKSLKALLT